MTPTLSLPMYAAALSRYVIAIAFGWSGIAKILGFARFKQALASYELLPSRVISAAAFIVVAAELSIAGAVALTERYLAHSLLAAGAALLVFTLVLFSLTMRGIVVPCYCFGMNVGTASGYDFARNLILLSFVIAGWLSFQLIGGGSTPPEVASSLLVAAAAAGVVLFTVFLREVVMLLKGWRRFPAE